MNSEVKELQTGNALTGLTSLPGVGNKKAALIAEKYGTWENFLGTDEQTLVDVLGANLTRKVLTHGLTEQLKVYDSNQKVVSFYEEHYPPILRTIPNPPLLLWWEGILPDQNVPLLAVVGTRTPNSFGSSVATMAAKIAAEHNIPTCSGLALGCDTLGHEGSLDNGSPTWAIVGQGLQTLPTGKGRGELAKRILNNNGGILSEVPPTTPVAGHHLVSRNRLQSGLSKATFIAQTGLPSGSKPAGTMHTAKFCVTQRRLLAVASPPESFVGDPVFAGNTALINGDNPEVKANFPVQSMKDFGLLCEKILTL